MKSQRQVGSTSNIFLVRILDSTVSTGAGKTGLAYNTSGILMYYKRDTGTASVAITPASITTLGTFVSGGFKEVDATNMKGVYEFHPPDAAFASGAKNVVFVISGMTGAADVAMEVELTATNIQDGVHFGLTGIPNAAAGATNGLTIVDANGNVAADIKRINGSLSAQKLDRGVRGTALCTVTSGSSASAIICSAISPAGQVNDQFKGKVITFDDATTTLQLRGQSALVNGFNNSTSTFDVSTTPLTVAPSSGDTFTIS